MQFKNCKMQITRSTSEFLWTSEITRSEPEGKQFKSSWKRMWVGVINPRTGIYMPVKTRHDQKSRACRTEQ